MFTEGYYHNTTSEDVIQFFRKGNEPWMAWRGTGWDKLGTWSVIHSSGKSFLEFMYNFAREEKYVLHILEEQSGNIVAFRLEGEDGRAWEFRIVP